MDGRCISQNELAKRWQISEATLERWRSQRKGPQFLRLGGQVRYRLADVEAYELEKLEVVADTQHPQNVRISPVQAKRISSKKSTA